MNKLLEYKDGVANWNLMEDVGIVYLLVIDDESYVGTTHQPRNRLTCHLSALLKGKHQNCLIQSKFDKIGSLVVYLLEVCNDDVRRFEREKYYIHKLQPRLNNEYYFKEWKLLNMNKEEMLRLVCEIIHNIRIKTGYSLKVFGSITGIEPKLIKEFEKEIVKISIDDIIVMFNALNINVFIENETFIIRHYKVYKHTKWQDMQGIRCRN